MTVHVTNVAPRRMRGSATVVLTGTGFNPVLAQNDVTVSGSGATVVAASAVSVSFTLPFLYSFGIIRDIHALCKVTNLANQEAALFWIRIKANVDEVGAEVLAHAVPGPFETLGAGTDRQRYLEAKDSERVTSLIDALVRDGAAGQILAGTGSGMGDPGGAAGQGGFLVADAAQATGLRWSKADLALTFPFGGACPAAATKLVAGGDNAAATGGSNTEHGAAQAGSVDLVWLLVKSAGPTLDRVRLLRSGTAVFDSGAGLGLGNNATFVGAPAAAVSQGHRLELEATALGGAVNLVGGLRLQPS